MQEQEQVQEQEPKGLTDSARAFGYEEPKEPYVADKLVQQEPTPDRQQAALIAAAVALGEDSPVIQRELMDRGYTLSEVSDNETTYLQLSKQTDDGLTPLYHMPKQDLPPEVVEEAALEFDRTGRKDLKDAILDTYARASIDANITF